MVKNKTKTKILCHEDTQFIKIFGFGRTAKYVLRSCPIPHKWGWKGSLFKWKKNIKIYYPQKTGRIRIIWQDPDPLHETMKRIRVAHKKHTL